MNYWKSKVVPKLKKVFEKSSVKKVAAGEACQSFDQAKEEYNKEFEEKKAELQPKVIEIYEASSAEIKALVKEPKDAGLKKHSTGVVTFLDELSKIEFPGSKPVYEACSKFGPSLVPGPIFFVFEKVSTFIVTEEKKEEAAPQVETSGKETVVEEEKKEEVVAEAEAETTEPTPAPAPAPAPVPVPVPVPVPTELVPKVEEVTPVEPPKP